MSFLSSTGMVTPRPYDNNIDWGKKKKKGTTNSSTSKLLAPSSAGPYSYSIIRSTSDDFFAGGPEEYGVFKLCRIAALNITEWGVGYDNARIAKVL